MTPTTPERWLPVVGYEGLYEVSDLGRVRSLDRVVTEVGGKRRRKAGRVLRLQEHDTGYDIRHRVQLCKDGDHRRWLVSALVLSAFVGPRPPGALACHNNGNPLDDRPANLRWDTPRANNLDMLAHGTHQLANRTHCPRDHRLEAPNLCPSTTAIGRRLCLACNRAHGNVRYARRCGRDLDLEATADDHYRRIMADQSA